MKNQVFLRMYCRWNLGDDLFLQILLERYKDTSFFLYGDKKWARGFSDYKNLKIGRPFFGLTFAKMGRKACKVRKKLCGEPGNRQGGASGKDDKTARLNDVWYVKNRMASRSRATILLGGSLFMEPEIQGLRNDYYRQDLPFFVLGVNYGPAASEAYQEWCARYLEGKTDVCFRDRASYELFRENPAVRLAPDIVFGIRKYGILPETVGNHDLKQGEGADKAGLFVSVIDLPARWEAAKDRKDFGVSAGINQGELLEKRILEEILRTLRAGEPVTLASFCDRYGDWDAVVRLLNTIQSTDPGAYREWRENKLLRAYRYRGAAEEREKILRAMAVADRVIGGRFHSIVLGLVLGKKVLPICYDVKSENLLADLGFGDKGIRILNPVDDQEMSEGYVGLSQEKTEELEKAAEQQFAVLDEYLGRSGAKN